MKRGGPLWRRGLACLTFGLLGCGGDARRAVELVTEDECLGRADGPLCSGAALLTCREQKIGAVQDCAAEGLICAPRVGCKVCEPRTTVCNGASRSRCADDGNSLSLVEECPAGTWCSDEGCRDLCADAITDRSYLGCEYWPVFTSNSQLSPKFKPAVAIGNGNLVAAHVSISKAGVPVTSLEVPARSAATVELAFQDELKNGADSVLVRQGAYHLISDVPVTVHQFNPLLFRIDGACPTDSPREDGACYSFTNDASLLFPASALRQDPRLTSETRIEFIAASRSAFVANADSGLFAAPSFVAITAVGGSPATVRVRVPAFTAASQRRLDDAGTPLPEVDALEALTPGSQLELVLSPGDVLQLRSAAPTQCEAVPPSVFCDPGSSYDLTGTEISAEGAIQVVSGHDCSNVPYDRAACDHLEESMVPLHAWGKSAVVTLPQRLPGSQYVLRVVSGAEANVISFDPMLHEPVTLARGQSIEFLAAESVLVSGTDRLMVAQYLVGQQQPGRVGVGDPSLSIAVPVDQYRTRYNFISPSTYLLNYVDIIARAEDMVTLDGELVSGFTPVGASRFRVATVKLSRSGAHEVRGTSVFGLGIQLYGVGDYTSYMLPGGLDLAPLMTGI